MYFEVNVTPKAKEAAPMIPESSFSLVLAPFQPQTRIRMESALYTTRECSLFLKNNSNRALQVTVTKCPPATRAVILNASELTIEANNVEELIIRWTPREFGTWRDVIQLTDSRRIKYDIALTTSTLRPKHKGHSISSKMTTNISHSILTSNNQGHILAPVVPNDSKRVFTSSENKSEWNSPAKKKRMVLSSTDHNKENIIRAVAREDPSLRKQRACKPIPIDCDLSTFLRSDSCALTPVPASRSVAGTNETRPSHSLQGEDLPDCLQFSLGQYRISLSPREIEKQDIRRVTYVTTPARRDLTFTEEGSEKLVDSLSLTRSDKQQSDFSMILDEMNLTTEESAKISAPKDPRSTWNATRSPIRGGNHTFEVNPEVGSKKTTSSEPPTEAVLPKNFAALSPVMPVVEKNRPYQLTASSPISIVLQDWDLDQHRSEIMVGAQAKNQALRTGPGSLDIICEETLEIHTRVVDKTYSKKPTNFRIDISPPKKSASKKTSPTRKFSPRKIARVSKDKNPGGISKLKRKSCHSTTLKTKTHTSVPGVRMAKLSLAGISRSKSPTPAPRSSQIVETSVKLRDSNDFLATLCNPDPFAASTTEDPFLARSLYCDEAWVQNQEGEFKKWLNALLTPPEHLSTNDDAVRVDVAKVWLSCRSKDEVSLAETKEALSARYHTNKRLNTLRKTACALLQGPEVVSVLSRVTVCIEKGTLVIRQDRDLHRDIGLQKTILELFLNYNPLWLRIGLEAVYGETIPLHSNSDIIGLSKFLLGRFFSDPHITKVHSHATVLNLRLSTFQPLMNKFMLKKFLFVVFFLDFAKHRKLIGHDPCLFHKKGTYKDSRSVLLRFSQEVLSGVGDVTRVLKPYGYVLLHKQTELDEYDYAVNNMATDLRDGVRLCRVMELITGQKNLTAVCRVPTISRLQKVHNVGIALKALTLSGYELCGDITAKSIADGHREKTLSLLWQIIYKFQAPRFNKAAECVQTWWRSKLWWVRVRNFLRKRRHDAAMVIQCAWRAYLARKELTTLRKERRRLLASRIQRAWRNYLATKPFVESLRRKQNAVLVVQRHWRARKAAASQLEKYTRILVAVKKIQFWWRAKLAERNYRRLVVSVRLVQSVWRGKISGRLLREEFLVKRAAVVKLQSWWRLFKSGRKDRLDFLRKKQVVRFIEARWLSRTNSDERREFLRRRRAALAVQKAWRRHRGTRKERDHLKRSRKALVLIQSWWRMTLARRRYHLSRGSALILQNWWRATLVMRCDRGRYLETRRAVITIQSFARMKMARVDFLNNKRAAVRIQTWWRAVVARRRFVGMKQRVVETQRRWRAKLLAREVREEINRDREAARVLQVRWRAMLQARLVRKSYLAKKAAATTIQKNYRMIRARRDFREQRSAVILIQSFWRSHRRTIEVRAEYLNLMRATIVTQRRYRAKLIGDKTRLEFTELKRSCVVVQRRWRGVLAGRSVRREMKSRSEAATVMQRKYRALVTRRTFLLWRESVIIIQNKWRATMLARRMCEEYRESRRRIVAVQRRFRARLSARSARKDFLALKSAVILVQRKWRAKKLGEACRLELSERRSAAEKISTWWLGIVETRILRKEFEEKREAVVVIQRWYRARVEAREATESYQILVGACVTIQRWWRTIFQRQAEERARISRAATVIQSYWRGHRVRCSANKEMTRLRTRTENAAKTANPSTILGNRLHIAIDLLQGYDSLGKLTQGLTALDTITRLLPRGCVALCEANLVGKIYNILERSNRSKPWMDTCLPASSILVSLAKYPPTKPYVWQERYVETIVRLLVVTYERERDLFLQLATLLWLLAENPDHAKIISEAPGTVRALTVINNTLGRKKSRLSLESKLNQTTSTTATSILPDVKPDWGLKRRRPRLFTTVHHATTVLCKKLKIKLA